MKLLFLGHGFGNAEDSTILLVHTHQTPAVHVKGRGHGQTGTCIYSMVSFIPLLVYNMCIFIIYPGGNTLLQHFGVCLGFWFHLYEQIHITFT